jgi:hypothetical protein
VGPPSGPLPIDWPDKTGESVLSGSTAASERSSVARTQAAADRSTHAGSTQPDRPVRRVRRGPRLIAVLASLVLAVALAGAGVWWFALRETGVEPAAYARSVCGSVRDWQRELDTRTSTLNREIARQTSPVAKRAATVGYFTELAARTATLETAVRAAGAPDLSGGKEYADTLVDTVSTQGGSLRDSAGRAGKLDVSRPKEFEYALNSLLASDAATPATVITTLARPPVGTPAELRYALAAEPACAPYTG